MRKFKKIIAWAAACSMMMAMLGGCGDKSTDGSEEITEEITETEEDTDEEAEDTTESTEEEQVLGVADGDRVIDLNFDDGDVDGCSTYTNGGKATISSVDGELVVDIENVGALDYANQVYYDGFALYEGCVYNLSFDIRSDVDRQIEYRIQINGGDYHAYAIDQIEINQETQHVSLEFTMDEDSDPAPRLCFNMGKFDGMDDVGEHNIYIDNILLEATDASNAQKIEPVPTPSVVKVNQVGYTKDADKVATVSNADAESFTIVDVSTGTEVYEGTLSDKAYDKSSDETYKTADFSQVTDEGTYKVVLNTGEESYEFEIGDTVYDDIYKDTVLMLYNQRCGSDLDADISGDFAHEACHTGNAIIYGTTTEVEVTGGWHDAGDYGRYVVSGAKAVADLMLAYEDSEAGLSDDIGIPESGNGVPDVLDEARYELEWMLKMQDASTGGVYHKVTCANFPETVMPGEETEQLILSPMSNTATGDFAAVMAKAAVLYKEYDSAFADSCLAAAKNAWSYLEAHEGDAGFTNPEDIVTGEYPDKNDKDEYFWAAVELYLATDEAEYLDYINTLMESPSKIKLDLGWESVGVYGVYDYSMKKGDNADILALLTDECDELVTKVQDDGYGSSLTSSYPWGSNMYIANNGMMLLMASKLTSNSEYTKCAEAQLDYILGRNAVSYCYVTGYGTVYPDSTHHRPSQVLGVTLKGMLVGGADSNLEDSYAKAVLYGRPIERCYVDNAQSYSCNEVTIYWNSPLIYLLASFK